MQSGPTMRILYLTDSLSDIDGVGRYAVRLISAMERAQPGLGVSVLLSRKHRPTSAQVPEHWDIRVGLPPDYFYYMARSRFWPSLSAAVWRVARAARKVDLVHAIKDYPHNLVGVLGARLAGVPCIATAHGTYSLQPVLDPRHRRYAEYAYRRFASLICVSRYTRGRLLEALPPEVLDPARCEVIPNAVEAEQYAQLPQLGPRPWHGKAFSLSIGETKERKGHHLALEAWCRVAVQRPELEHYLVGRLSADDYEAALRATVTKHGLQERVHFLGNIDEADKNDLLGRAELFLHTPVTAADGGFEGFGLVYLEASASGTACLGTLGCGAEDAIVDGVTGLLVKPEVDAVEAGLRRILLDPAQRQAMGQAGIEHARASSWDKNALAVLALYERALAEKRS